MANERNYQMIGHAVLAPMGGLLADRTTPEFALGTEIRDNRGNVFRFVEAAEAIVEGDVLTEVVEGAWDSGILIDGATAVGDTAVNIDTITTAKAAGFYTGYYITQASATGLGVAYRIKSHDAFAASGSATLQMDDPMSEIFANNAALLIFKPYRYELTDAATEVIKGVAIGSITLDRFGWVQVSGYFQAVKLGHSTSAATVLNEPLVPIAANAGAVQGMAGNAEADIMEAAASGLIALRTVALNTTGFITASSKGIL